MTERLDPLATAESVEAGYKRYLKTLIAPREPELAGAFDAAIDSSRTLTKGPLLELTPPYKPGASLRELVAQGVLHEDFGALASPALSMDRPLYVHQEIAVRKAVAGRNLVVSTGTGSGKTESFLLPILNALIAERAAGTPGPGVRALLLYPMNALANDQLARLRTLLAEFPDITFGRYTGETAEKEVAAAAEYRASHEGAEPLPNEMLSREQMRAAPPHLLLTNYAMLEYLLLRPQDLELFDSGDTWRFIALDEAHVYDGAQGAEVGLLLRRLRERVAATDIQCIATSASLTGSSPQNQGREATDFASALFDAPFEFVAGDPDRQDLVTATRLDRPAEATWRFDTPTLRRWATPGADLTAAAAEAGHPDPATALHHEHHVIALRAHLTRGPVDTDTLAHALWPDDPERRELLNLLVEVGSQVIDADGDPVLSARYHMFVRASEGAYASFTPDGPRVFLGRHKQDPETGRAVFEFGACRRCGAVHLAGQEEHDRGRLYFRPMKKDSAVRWVVLTDADTADVIDEDDATLARTEFTERGTGVQELCTDCGVLGAACDVQCPGGTRLRVRAHVQKSKGLDTCTECGALGRGIVRRLRTDVNAAPAVLTTALYQHLPTADVDDESYEQVGEGRKLLMFSDSRQAAAFAAPYLDRTYGRLLQRRHLTAALTAPAAEDEDLTTEDLAHLTGREARRAHHFGARSSKMSRDRIVNTWVMAELIAMDQRQSLEGLGLLRISLARPRRGAIRAGLWSSVWTASRRGRCSRSWSRLCGSRAR